MKIATYTPTKARPVQLRMMMLQMLAQTRPPDVMVVLENGLSQESCWWAVEDVVRQLEDRHVKVIHLNIPTDLPNPDFYMIPLAEAIKLECDVYFKIDDDDLYFADHILSLSSKLGIFTVTTGYDKVKAVYTAGLDFAINSQCSTLTLPFGGGYSYSEHVDFGAINPTGGMSDNCCFTHKFAEQYVKDMMEAPVGMADDAVMANITMPKFKCLKGSFNTTACYVSHGTNMTTVYWSVKEWCKKNGLAVVPEAFAKNIKETS